MLTRTQLIDRLTKGRQAKMDALHKHEQLQRDITETVAQINALIGREAELMELLALFAAPKDEA